MHLIRSIKLLALFTPLSLLAQQAPTQPPASVLATNPAAISAVVTADTLSKISVNLTEADTLIDPELQGMTLKFSNQSKMVNVELPTGDFLELKFHLPYFTPPKESFVHVSDIKAIYELRTTLDRLRNLPLQEFIQPASQKELVKVLSDMDKLAKNLEARLYTFGLTEDDLKVLAATKGK